MQCQRCGASLKAGARRCERCGTAASVALSPQAIKGLVCSALTLLMALGVQICLFLPWLTIDEAVIVPFRLGEAAGLGSLLRFGFTVLAIAMQVTVAMILLFAVLSFFVKHPRLILLARLPGVVLISVCAGMAAFALVVGLLGSTTVLSFFELHTTIATHSATYVVLILSIGIQVTATLWRDSVEEQ